MMKNISDAKVLRKEGRLICTVTDGTRGTITCDTQGKPVVNVVETDQIGMKMRVSITMNGKAVTDFELLDDRQMKVTASDVSQLKVDAHVTLGKKEMPFPAADLIGTFGKAGTTMSYKCDGDQLSLLPHLEGYELTWQNLQAVK
jgi:hypothetical protein